MPATSTSFLPVASSSSLLGAEVKFGVRPEDLTVTSKDDWILKGDVTLVESLGEVTLLYLEDGISEEPIIVKLTGTHKFDRGSTVHLSASPEKMHAFTADDISLRHLND